MTYLLFRLRPVLWIALSISLFAYPQQETDQAFEYPNQNLEEGEACLKNKNENCEEIFKRILDTLLDSVDDSAVAMYYIDVIELYSKYGNQTDKIVLWADEGISFTENRPLPVLESKLLFHAGFARIQSGISEGTEDLFNRCRTKAFEGSDLHVQVQSHIGLATWFRFSGEMDHRISELEKALVLAKKSGNTKDLLRVENSLAMTFYDNNDLPLAAEYFERVANSYLNLDDSLSYYRKLTNWANTMIALGKPEKAYPTLSECVDYMKSKGAEKFVSFPQAQLGRALISLKKYDQATTELQETVERCDRLNLLKQKAYVQMLLAKSLSEQKKFTASLSYTKDALAYYEDQSILSESLDALEMHANSLEQLGRYDESLLYVKKLMTRKDSLMDADKMSKIAELQGQLDLETKEKEICAQQNEIADLEEEGRRIRNRNVAGGILFLLSGMLAYLFIKRKSALVALKESENEKLTIVLEGKNRELTNQALHLAQKNELLHSLKKDLQSLQKDRHDSDILALENKIKFDEQIDDNWSQFMIAFTETKQGFFDKIRGLHSDLSKNDLRLSALLSMNLGTKEIANILNISDQGVKKARYRLRKRLQLEPKASIEKYLSGF